MWLKIELEGFCSVHLRNDSGVFSGILVSKGMMSGKSFEEERSKLSHSTQLMLSSETSMCFASDNI